jgi:hypothetical protein
MHDANEDAVEQTTVRIERRKRWHTRLVNGEMGMTIESERCEGEGPIRRTREGE